MMTIHLKMRVLMDLRAWMTVAALMVVDSTVAALTVVDLSKRVHYGR